MKPDDEKQVLKAALAVRELAYAPYSNFAVGAAILDEAGRIGRVAGIRPQVRYTPPTAFFM